MTTPTCNRCGSDDVTRDATVRWDDDAQEWSISGVFDDATCGQCNNEGDSILNWSDTTPSDDTIPEHEAAALREIARDTYGSDEIEIDDDAEVHHNDDGGTWVAAWVYLDTPDDEESDEGPKRHAVGVFEISHGIEIPVPFDTTRGGSDG